MCRHSSRLCNDMMLRYHYPYTYSYLTTFISTLEADPYAGKLFSRKPQLGLAQRNEFHVQRDATVDSLCHKALRNHRTGMTGNSFIQECIPFWFLAPCRRLVLRSPGS